MPVSSTSNRTYGLSGSGIDVDSIVEKLMTSERQPYVKLQQQQTLVGWKKEDYNTMYTGINEFRDNKLFKFQMQSNLAPKTVTSSSASTLTVTANSDAVNVNHNIKITQLASAVTETSSGPITTGASKTSLASQFGLGGPVTININGKQIAVSAAQSINDVVSGINKSGAGVTANYDVASDRFFLYTNNTGSTSNIDFSGTSAQGLSFLSNNLKLSAYGDVNNSGIGSVAMVGINETATLQSQFGTLAASFSLGFSDGTKAHKGHKAVGTTGIAGATLTIDPTKDSLNDVITKINATKLATASLVNGKFTLKSNTGAPLSLASSDAVGLSFLTNQLNLTTVTPSSSIVDSKGVSGNVLGSLQHQFSGISGMLNLKVSDGTTTSTIAIDTTKSLDDMITQINGLKNSDGKQLATASFEKGKFLLKATQTDTNLDLSGSDTNTIAFLNNNLKLTTKLGLDAQFKLDGVNMTQPSNKFIVAGLTYNLQATGTSMIGVQSDTDKLITNVKTFIDDYNKQLTAVYGKVTEARYKDYEPLSDDKKKSMKEGDVTLWTTKARSGMLRNDETLKTLGEGMQGIFSHSVVGLNSKYDSAASIGIASNDDWTENGKLYIDEEKLKKALQDDPDIVYKIFGTTSTAVASQGLAVQLSGVLKTASAQIVKEAGVTPSTTSDVTSVTGRQYKEYATNMSDLNTKLVAKENRYYTQFNTMEAALSKLNQQSSSLASMMGNS